ncbi:suppressor of tub2 mutation [Thoreauomyces humboldtii]|nr:suppressor of tub2 mutation [Thoreauomyces humboldtii]
MTALAAVDDLGNIFERAIDPIADVLIFNLLKLTGQAKKVISSASLNSILGLLSQASYQPRYLQYFATALNMAKSDDSKNHLERSGGLDIAEKALKKGLQDANGPVRQTCRDAFTIFQNGWPQRGGILFETLDAATRKAISRAQGAIPPARPSLKKLVSQSAIIIKKSAILPIDEQTASALDTTPQNTDFDDSVIQYDEETDIMDETMPYAEMSIVEDMHSQSMPSSPQKLSNDPATDVESVQHFLPSEPSKAPTDPAYSLLDQTTQLHDSDPTDECTLAPASTSPPLEADGLRDRIEAALHNISTGVSLKANLLALLQACNESTSEADDMDETFWQQMTPRVLDVLLVYLTSARITDPHSTDSQTSCIDRGLFVLLGLLNRHGSDFSKYEHKVLGALLNVFGDRPSEETSALIYQCLEKALHTLDKSAAFTSLAEYLLDGPNERNIKEWQEDPISWAIQSTGLLLPMLDGEVPRHQMCPLLGGIATKYMSSNSSRVRRAAAKTLVPLSDIDPERLWQYVKGLSRPQRRLATMVVERAAAARASVG